MHLPRILRRQKAAVSDPPHVLTIMLGTTRRTDYLFVYSPATGCCCEYRFAKLPAHLQGLRNLLEPTLHLLRLLATTREAS